ncbi:hypothetical protein BAY1663_04992 [Pseudomonas sp. BAY1663]|nr:hypothetical protein BAY1663_04992 [Pseudomonas sp. BAY1663]
MRSGVDRLGSHRRRRNRLGERCRAVILRHQQGERAAGAGRALHADLSAEQLRQFAGNRQAQAGAAITAIGGAVGLAEGLEDRRLLFDRDADAGIADGKGQLATGVPLDAQGHRALLGELEGIGQQVLENLLQAMTVAEQRRRQVVAQHHLEGERFLPGQGQEQVLQAVDQAGEDRQLGMHLELAGFDLGDVEDVVDQGEQIVAGRIDRAGELHLVLAEVAFGVVRQQLGQDQRAVQRRAQLVGHVGEEFGLVAAGALQLVGARFEHQPGVVQAPVLLVHLVALAGQDIGLLGQLLVGLLQFGLLLFQVRLRLAQGTGLLLELLVGGAQLFLLHLQFLVELLGLGEHFLQALAIAGRLDGRADGGADAPQQFAILLAQRSQEAQLDHAVEHAAVLQRHQQHRTRRGLAQLRGHLQVIGRQVLQRQQAALQGNLADQTGAELQGPAALQMSGIVGVLGDPLQLAVLHHEQRADGHVEVMRKEAQHALAQRRQGQFTDDRLAQLRLPGAVPGLLLQRLGVGPLPAQRRGITRRQRRQVAPAEEHQQTAEEQAEQQETADQRGGNHLRAAGEVGTLLSLGGNEFIQQRAPLGGQAETTPGTDIGDDRTTILAALDGLLGEAEPAPMQRLDFLDTAQLQRIVPRVILEPLQFATDRRQPLVIGLEEGILAGDQIAAHAGFQFGHQPQRLMGMGHAPHRTVDRVADAEQVIDDGAEEERTEKTEAQRHGDIAIEDAPEIVLVDEGLAHLAPFAPPDCRAHARRMRPRRSCSDAGVFLSVWRAIGSVAPASRDSTRQARRAQKADDRRNRQAHSAPGDDPDGVDDAGNVAEQGQQDVQPEGAAETHLQEHSQRRQQNRTNDADKIHHGLRRSDWARGACSGIDLTGPARFLIAGHACRGEGTADRRQRQRPENRGDWISRRGCLTGTGGDGRERPARMRARPMRHAASPFEPRALPSFIS